MNFGGPSFSITPRFPGSTSLGKDSLQTIRLLVSVLRGSAPRGFKVPSGSQGTPPRREARLVSKGTS